MKSKLGGLNLFWSCLDQDSQSRHCQQVFLDDRENLDSFKKLVSMIEKSRSRWRNLNFVSTPPSGPKSLDWDHNLSRFTKSIYFFYLNPSLVDFIIFLNQTFSICWDWEAPQKVSLMLRYLNKYWKVLTNLKIFICFNNLDKNIEAAKSQLKSLDLQNERNEIWQNYTF